MITDKLKIGNFILARENVFQRGGKVHHFAVNLGERFDHKRWFIMWLDGVPQFTNLFKKDLDKYFKRVKITNQSDCVFEDGMSVASIAKEDEEVYGLSVVVGHNRLSLKELR